MTASPYSPTIAQRPEETDTWFVDQLSMLPRTLEDKFNAYHAAHPEVYAAIRATALRGKALGIKRWSVDAICQILRWESAIQTGNPDGYKINDHHTAFYNRMLCADPEFEGMFHMRVRRSF